MQNNLLHFVEFFNTCTSTHAHDVVKAALCRDMPHNATSIRDYAESLSSLMNRKKQVITEVAGFKYSVGQELITNFLAERSIVIDACFIDTVDSTKWYSICNLSNGIKSENKYVVRICYIDDLYYPIDAQNSYIYNVGDKIFNIASGEVFNIEDRYIDNKGNKTYTINDWLDAQCTVRPVAVHIKESELNLTYRKSNGPNVCLIDFI